MESVCQTLEGALEKAILSEQDSFEVYRKALKVVQNPHARMVLKDLALEELEHKHILPGDTMPCSAIAGQCLRSSGFADHS